MDDNVEIVIVLHLRHFLYNGIQQHIMLLHFVDDGLLFICLRPCTSECIKRGVHILDGSTCVVSQLLCTQRSAVLANNLYHLMHNLGLFTFHIIFVLFRLWRWWSAAAIAFSFSFSLAIAFAFACAIIFLLVCIAIKYLIKVFGGGIAKVKYLESHLAFLLKDTSTTTYHLLEGGFATNLLIYHNQAAGLAVHACSQQVTRSGNDRIFCVWVNEVIKQRLAYTVIAGNADNVVWIAFHHVLVHANKQFTHQQGFFLRRTEHDSFCHSSYYFHHLRNTMGHYFLAFHNIEHLAKFKTLKLVRFYLEAFQIHFVCFRMIT